MYHGYHVNKSQSAVLPARATCDTRDTRGTLLAEFAFPLPKEYSILLW